MNVETVTPAIVLAMILSLVMEWVPNLRDKWEELNENRKRGIMALGVAVITLVVMAYNCWGQGQCPADWVVAIRDVLLVALAAATANQVTHALNPVRPAAAMRGRAYSK